MLIQIQAIFCGINPENGKFFVATKSVFNKNPKLNYTNSDIDKNHAGGLAEKLKVALKELSKLGITGVIQGDMMYTKSDLQTKTIEGEDYIIFQPNTIVYAIPKNVWCKLECPSLQELSIIFLCNSSRRSLTQEVGTFPSHASNFYSRKYIRQQYMYSRVSNK